MKPLYRSKTFFLLAFCGLALMGGPGCRSKSPGKKAVKNAASSAVEVPKTVGGKAVDKVTPDKPGRN